MVNRVIDVVAMLCGVLMGLIGVRWLADPGGAAAQLGMPLAEGAGRASQIGDGASFFLSAAVMIFVGLFTRRPALLVAGGLMIGVVAIFRIFAFAVHGAAFTPEPIVVEVVTLVACLLAARARRTVS